MIAQANARIRAQDQSNSRPRTPALSKSELIGYPKEFWPYLVRLESGYIGMTSHSRSDRPEMLDLHAIWSRQNKSEDTFVPDPRLFSWDGWKEVPLEFQPFFEIDPVFGTPQRPLPCGQRLRACHDPQGRPVEERMDDAANSCRDRETSGRRR